MKTGKYIRVAAQLLLTIGVVLAGSTTAWAQDTDGATMEPVETLREHKPHTLDTENAAALERVRSFLRSVVTGRFLDYLGDYVGSGLTLKQGEATRTASLKEVGDAIQKTIASGRRQIKSVQVSGEKSAITAKWESSGTRADHGETVLGSLIDDGEHMAIFAVEKDKILSIQWQ